jgi:hypothetical protein
VVGSVANGFQVNTFWEKDVGVTKIKRVCGVSFFFEVKTGSITHFMAGDVEFGCGFATLEWLSTLSVSQRQEKIQS